MPRKTAENVETIPVGPLGIIAMPGCEACATRSTNTWSNGAQTRPANISRTLRFMATSATPTR